MKTKTLALFTITLAALAFGQAPTYTALEAAFAHRSDFPVKRTNDPNGIRTRVTAVKGRCPGPLDDRVAKAGQYRIEFAARKANWQRCFAPALRGHHPCARLTDSASSGQAQARYSLSIKLDNQLGRTSSSAAMLRQNFRGVLHE